MNARTHRETVRDIESTILLEVEKLLKTDAPQTAEIVSLISTQILDATARRDEPMEDELRAQLAAIAEIHKIKVSKAASRTLFTITRVSAALLLASVA